MQMHIFTPELHSIGKQGTWSVILLAERNAHLQIWNMHQNSALPNQMRSENDNAAKYFEKWFSEVLGAKGVLHYLDYHFQTKSFSS